MIVISPDSALSKWRIAQQSTEGLKNQFSSQQKGCIVWIKCFSVLKNLQVWSHIGWRTILRYFKSVCMKWLKVDQSKDGLCCVFVHFIPYSFEIWQSFDSHFSAFMCSDVVCAVEFSEGTKETFSWICG